MSGSLDIICYVLVCSFLLVYIWELQKGMNTVSVHFSEKWAINLSCIRLHIISIPINNTLVFSVLSRGNSFLIASFERVSWTHFVCNSLYSAVRYSHFPLKISPDSSVINLQILPMHVFMFLYDYSHVHMLIYMPLRCLINIFIFLFLRIAYFCTFVRCLIKYVDPYMFFNTSYTFICSSYFLGIY